MDLSLLHGWLPWTIDVLAAVALVVAVGLRDRRWQLRTVPIIVGVSAAVAALTGILLRSYVITDPIPIAVWAWGGAALAAVLAVVLGWRSARWWRRGVGGWALVLAVGAAGLSLNDFVGYYPTVGDAIDDLSGQPVPGEVSLNQLPGIVGYLRTGRIVPVDIPDTASHFTHRQELVYLPPVWFRTAQRPRLPVVLMIGGEYAAPANWIRAGHAQEIADRYAAAHDGLAPILVFADATGSFRVDTECVDGKAGPAQDHLTKDVPPYVIANFAALPDPANWGVVGWSMGGTCAITLAAAHPEVFGHFVDISGDLGPNIGNKSSTIAKLYGGNAAAWAANDPLTVLAKHGRYHGSSGRFIQGSTESAHIKQAAQLAAAARKAGILTQNGQMPGKHNWELGSTAFESALPWLSDQIGLSSSDRLNARR